VRNIKLTIQYDGTRYSGWQIQKNGRAIQQVIRDAIKKITGEKVNLIGSGRTDAGVHAEAQVANFKTKTLLPLKNIYRALNSELPEDIVISGVEEVKLNFDAQRLAKSKLYRYTIFNSDFVDPFVRKYAAKCFYKLDLGAMRKAAKILVGRHDFTSFQTVDGRTSSAIRTVRQIKFEKRGCLVYIYVEGNGFLYNMVRSIAGTLVEVGRGKFSVGYVKKILANKDRRCSGPTMPARGLCLVRVDY